MYIVNVCVFLRTVGSISVKTLFKRFLLYSLVSNEDTIGIRGLVCLGAKNGERKQGLETVGMTCLELVRTLKWKISIHSSAFFCVCVCVCKVQFNLIRSHSISFHSRWFNSIAFLDDCSQLSLLLLLLLICFSTEKHIDKNKLY